ncbi:hypothetical protein K445DRAFT_314226 [Daldinia sp. EC12]|nr:hypothetical protein K445DRAFT_314226 [Daldinia sp. EC12]
MNNLEAIVTSEAAAAALASTLAGIVPAPLPISAALPAVAFNEFTETRTQLAVQAFAEHKFESVRSAAIHFGAPYKRTLSRYNGAHPW